MKTNIALVGGTFDPLTKGHVSLINRASDIFETVYVSICRNSDKNCMFSPQERFEIIQTTFADNDNIIPVMHDGLIADLAKEKNAVIVKGLRYSSDFDYEHLQAESNFMIGGVETIFLSSHPDEMFITSSLVRELIKAKKDFSPYVPKNTVEIIKSYLKK